ncbi:hypothetical protein K491DRAFT_611465 [Lophiostoma macrostomum CBS 122681]|uniref:BTB domain-containing protein n=1 Tax=Lophiostoma macrostomum CBS 122681 TaxID=1314788 RepID=A0A6A6SQ61_9PLEO|nr:hypothetical protein K491DRAFT_611465 [Lophiostoma macrostomum CBS 122681]
MPVSRKKWTPTNTTWPYLEFHQIHKGYPITFSVGPNGIRFDVHNRIISTESPLFMNRHGNAKHITRMLILPRIQHDDFHLLMNWIYQERPPEFSTAEGLPVLMRLWVTCAALAIWKKQNTILRLAMALMQPAYFEVDIETVIYVYSNTPTHSKLRKFIVAIFCQRSTTQPHFFSPLTSGLGIWEDVTEFQKVLNEVRKVSPVGIDGYDLAEAFFNHDPIDWSRVRHPLPEFLVRTIFSTISRLYEAILIQHRSSTGIRSPYLTTSL